MNVWQIILLAWMAYQLFMVFRGYFTSVRGTGRRAAEIISLFIGVGIWFVLFAAMLNCGLLDGIQAGRIRIN